MLDQNKKRMVFFGCSFTVGSELIDHELLGISFEECNKLKSKWLADKKSIDKFEKYIVETTGIPPEQIANISSRRSYAAKLSRKLGLEHVNLAVAGSAVDHSVLNLFAAYHNGQLNPETDIIFLGITSPHRYLSFAPNLKGIPVSRVMGYTHIQDADMHYNDYKVMQTYIFALENFKNFCIAKKFDFYMQPLLHKNLHFYTEDDPLNDNIFADISSEWGYLPAFRKLYDGILEYSVNPNISMFATTYDITKHGLCGFKHPTEKGHELFAEVLYDEIINQ